MGKKLSKLIPHSSLLKIRLQLPMEPDFLNMYEVGCNHLSPLIKSCVLTDYFSDFKTILSVFFISVPYFLLEW